MHHQITTRIEEPTVSMPAYDGETLFLKGDPCEQTFEIRSGVARAVTYSGEGNRQIMAFFFPGDVIGLPLSEGHRYSAEAVSGLQYVRRSADSFWGRVGEYHRTVQPASRDIWREEKAFIARSMIAGRLGVQSRVAAFLVYLSRRLPRTDGTYEFSIPQSDVASYLATSPETICRTFRVLRDKRIIAMPQKNRLQILDEYRLKEIAERC